MKQTPEEFGARIAAARKDLGLTLQEVAERTGLSMKTVWVAEQGKARTHKSTRRLIAQALQLEEAC